METSAWSSEGRDVRRQDDKILTLHLGFGVPIVAQQLMNPTSIHEDEDSIPDLAPWVKDPALPWL